MDTRNNELICSKCKKKILEQESTFEKFMHIIPMNLIFYMTISAFILTQLDYYLYIPWNTEHGANLNYNMLLMFLPIIFIIIYTYLYINKKVNGKLLLFK